MLTRRFQLMLTSVLILALSFATYQFLDAADVTEKPGLALFPSGNFMISVTTGMQDAKLVSDAELTTIGGAPFLKCKLIDTDAHKAEFRGTICYVAVDKITSIQQFPSKGPAE